MEQRVLQLRADERRGQDWIGPELGLSARTVSAILRRHRVPYLHECDPLTGEVIRSSKATTVRYGPLFGYNSAVLSAKGRSQVKSMVRSLTYVKAVTCEGNSDYGGGKQWEAMLARKRAAVVCQALRAYGANAYIIAANDERPSWILRDMEETLPLHHLDQALAVRESNANARACVQLNARTIR